MEDVTTAPARNARAEVVAVVPESMAGPPQTLYGLLDRLQAAVLPFQSGPAFHVFQVAEEEVESTLNKLPESDKSHEVRRLWAQARTRFLDVRKATEELDHFWMLLDALLREASRPIEVGAVR